MRVAPSVTVQFEGTPERTTVWLPVPSAVNVSFELMPIGRLGLASTVTVYPLGRLEPDVAVVTSRLPVDWTKVFTMSPLVRKPR